MSEGTHDSKLALSRRKFMQWFGAMSASFYALGGKKAVGGGIGSKDSLLYEDENLSFDEKMEVYTNSHPHNCGGKCFFKVYVKNVNGKRRMVKLTSEGDVGLDGKDPDGLPKEMPGDEDIRKLQIRACPRGYAQIKRVYAPDRLKYPLVQTKKKGDITGFKRISWEEALNIYANKMNEAKKRAETLGYLPIYVPEASGALSLLHLAATLTMRFLGVIGDNKYGFVEFYGITSSGSYSAAGLYTFDMITTGALNSSMQSIYENSKLVILWGADPTTSFMYRSQTQFIMSKIKEKGIPIIVVDPMFTDAAATYGTGTAKTPKWIPVRPGGDSYLANAMMYVIYKKGLYDKEYAKKRFYGFFKEDEGKEMLSLHINSLLRGASALRDTEESLAYRNKLIHERTQILPEGGSYESYIEWLDKTYGGYNGVLNYFADRSGVDGGVIESFATDYATMRPAAMLSMLAPQRHIQGVQYAKSIMCLTALTNNMLNKGGGPGGIPLADILCGGLPLGILYPIYTGDNWTETLARLADRVYEIPFIKGALNSSITSSLMQMYGTIMGILLFLSKGMAPVGRIIEGLQKLNSDQENLYANLLKFLGDWLPKSNLENYMANMSLSLIFAYIPMIGLVINPGNKNLSFYKWADGVLNGMDERPAKTFVEENFGPEEKDMNKRVEIDILLNVASNMLQQHGNTNRNIYALTQPSNVTGKEVYMITHDQMMTPSARYSDLVLPINTHFEREDVSFGVGPYCLNMSKAIDSLFESKSDMQVFYELCNKMGYNFFKHYEGVVAGAKNWDEIENKLKRYCYSEFLIFPWAPKDAKSKIPSYEQFVKQGIIHFGTVGAPTYNDMMNLGIPNNKDGQIRILPSDTAKVNFFSLEQYRRIKTYHEADPNHPDAAFLRGSTAKDQLYNRMDPRPIPLYNFEGYDMIRDNRTKYKLVMIAKASRNKVHSTYDNVSFIKDEFPGNIWLNTKDAEERGIKNDDIVYVYNDRGCVKVKAYVTERMRPGSCNLEQGSWYTPSTTEFVNIKMDVHNVIEDPNHKENIRVPVDVGGCSATLVPFLESGPHDPHQTVMGAGGSGMSHNAVLIEVSKTKPE